MFFSVPYKQSKIATMSKLYKKNIPYLICPKFGNSNTNHIIENKFQNANKKDVIPKILKTKLLLRINIKPLAQNSSVNNNAAGCGFLSNNGWMKSGNRATYFSFNLEKSSTRSLFFSTNSSQSNI